MFATLLICALAFAESKTLAFQIALDRQGFSCNTIDGVWGVKSVSAVNHCATARGERPPASPEAACARWFPDAPAPLKTDTVRAEDIAALTAIPKTPADKARLDHLGYETLPEMYAERGHLSVKAFLKLNPEVDWSQARPGQRYRIPDFPSIESLLATGARSSGVTPRANEATRLVISLSRYEICAYNGKDVLLAVFPCSIARDKAKIPQGDLRIVTRIPNPNYTYAPDHVKPGEKAAKHVLMAGPNNPVGVAWMGLSLPGFGIHGTPTPETIGRAESHGCFRLANWNAARLFALVRIGTRVEVVP